ncbi:MAG: hypothetical protein HN348_03300 [Proteobacteria bacterium]|nr:hypothetical protein [Pseudomonadota bacterium]
MNQYRHAAVISESVHDGLVTWARHAMEEGGLEEMEIWGRFPPDGTIRSYLVLFPYRVGPGPLLRDNAPGTSLFLGANAPTEVLKSVPPAWVQFANLMYEGIELIFPSVAQYAPGQKVVVSPYPILSELPGPLAAWYQKQIEDGDPEQWVVHSGQARARPPALAWRQGITITVHYLAVAHDPGRGASTRTSDVAPLALPALAVLTTAIQLDPNLIVMVPPRPLPSVLGTFATAFVESWEEVGGNEESIETFRAVRKVLEEPFEFDFAVHPMSDLNDQEFALLTQALQRPLQAVLNMRIRFPVGLHAEFLPSPSVYPSTRRTER